MEHHPVVTQHLVDAQRSLLFAIGGSVADKDFQTVHAIADLLASLSDLLQ